MCFLLVTLLVQPFSTAAITPAQAPAAVDGGSSKLIVQNTDKATLGAVAQSKGEMLADYGSFSLWRVGDSAVAGLKSLPSVSYDSEFDTIYLRQRSIDTRKGPDLGVPAELAQTPGTSGWTPSPKAAPSWSPTCPTTPMWSGRTAPRSGGWIRWPPLAKKSSGRAPSIRPTGSRPTCPA
jgi:hypothetical protein